MADKPKPGLQPLPLGESKPAEPVAVAPEVLASPDPVEKFIADNPESTAPAAEPSSEPVAETPPPATKPLGETTLPPKPRDAATPAEPVATTLAEPKPAEPVKPSYAPDEKIALAEGAEWTRDQIVTRLREYEAQRTQFDAVKAESEGYKSALGGATVEQVTAEIRPLLERIAQNPNEATFLDGYFSNPGKAEYLEQCAAFYDQQPGMAPAPAPKPAVDPVLAKQVQELNTWREAQTKRDGAEKFSRDFATCVQKYPFLASDANLRTDLVLTMQALYQQAKAANFPHGEDRPWLLDALALKASIYDAMAISRTVQPSEPAPVGASTILGTNGVEPDPARPKPIQRKVFSDTSEVVDRFIHDVPANRFQ